MRLAAAEPPPYRPLIELRLPNRRKEISAEKQPPDIYDPWSRRERGSAEVFGVKDVRKGAAKNYKDELDSLGWAYSTEAREWRLDQHH